MGEESEDSIRKLMDIGKLAPQTKANYILRIRAYLRRVKMNPDQFIREVKRRPKWFEEDFIKFIGEVKKSSATSTVAFWRDSLKRFLEINRVKGVDWEYINQFLPKVVKSGQDRAPTIEELRKVVSVADLRTKCLILFLSSSGARIGSIDYLRWRDLTEVESDAGKLAKVVIYRGEPEEYTSYATPECYEHLLSYRGMRENVGEKVGAQSPVFVQEFNKRDFQQGKVKPVGVRTLKNQLGELLNQMGMRAKIVDKGNYRSYEFKQAHSFRKWFKTRMEMSGVKPIVTELLMGHDIGVSGSYMKPTDEELLDEYTKAIPNLTIVGSAMEKTDRNVEFKREILLKVGGYGKEEVDKLDLANLEDSDVQKMVRERLLGAMTNNGNHQRVIPINEVETYLTEGWEYVAALPTGKAVLKLPN